MAHHRWVQVFLDDVAFAEVAILSLHHFFFLLCCGGCRKSSVRTEPTDLVSHEH